MCRVTPVIVLNLIKYCHDGFTYMPLHSGILDSLTSHAKITDLIENKLAILNLYVPNIWTSVTFDEIPSVEINVAIYVPVYDA